MQMRIKGCEQFENTPKVEERGETFSQSHTNEVWADRGVFLLKYVCGKKQISVIA